MNPAWRKFAAQTVPTTAFTRAAAHEERDGANRGNDPAVAELNLVKGTAAATVGLRAWSARRHDHRRPVVTRNWD